MTFKDVKADDLGAAAGTCIRTKIAGAVRRAPLPARRANASARVSSAVPPRRSSTARPRDGAAYQAALLDLSALPPPPPRREGRHPHRRVRRRPSTPAYVHGYAPRMRSLLPRVPRRAGSRTTRTSSRACSRASCASRRRASSPASTTSASTRSSRAEFATCFGFTEPEVRAPRQRTGMAEHARRGARLVQRLPLRRRRSSITPGRS